MPSPWMGGHGLAGWGFEKRGLEGGVPASSRGVRTRLS